MKFAKRKGRMGETQEMNDFNEFVEGTRLVDDSLMNRKFTWYDKFLLSVDMRLLGTNWT